MIEKHLIYIHASEPSGSFECLIHRYENIHTENHQLLKNSSKRKKKDGLKQQKNTSYFLKNVFI